MFVIFDDCWNKRFSLGPQPKQRPRTYNSAWVQSPGQDSVRDQRQWPRLEKDGEPEIFFHDIFRPDGTFLYPEEEKILRSLNPNKEGSRP